MRYQYHINLDERGEFNADVRNENENTVFEIVDNSIFEDGFMRHKNDVAGLGAYLLDIGIVGPADTLED